MFVVHIISRKGLIEDEESNLDFLDTPPNPGPHELLGAISRLPKMVIRVVFGCCGWFFEDHGDDHLYMVVNDIRSSKRNMI